MVFVGIRTGKILLQRHLVSNHLIKLSILHVNNKIWFLYVVKKPGLSILCLFRQARACVQWPNYQVLPISIIKTEL